MKDLAEPFIYTSLACSLTVSRACSRDFIQVWYNPCGLFMISLFIFYSNKYICKCHTNVICGLFCNLLTAANNSVCWTESILDSTMRLKLFAHVYLARLQNRKRQKVNIKHGDPRYVKDGFELIRRIKIRCLKCPSELPKVDKRSPDQCCHHSVQRNPTRWCISGAVALSSGARLAGIACQSATLVIGDLLKPKLQKRGNIGILTNRPLSGRVKYKSVSLYNRAHRFYQLCKSCSYKSPDVDYVEPPQVF